MKFTPAEIMQYVKEEDIQFIRLAFCDIFGKQKNTAIMASELKRAFEVGIAIDASAIAGFGGEVRSAAPSANPYLAFALLIYAALDGIKRNL